MMFSRARRGLTYANVTVTVALVFAMCGGAYAAGRYVITSTKQISPKVLKVLAAKNGKDGVAGPTGATGSAGAPGARGEVGPAGKDGVSGTLGEKGVLGEKGTLGREGSPWTAGGTLPSGATETGAWVLRTTANAEEEFRLTAISFPISLGSPVKTEFISVGGTPPGGKCKGSVEKPEAEPGWLCVFAGKSLVYKGGLSPGQFLTPSGGLSTTETSGTELAFETLKPTTPGEEVSAEGTWAVTAE
jgi:hypothetical protein